MNSFHVTSVTGAAVAAESVPSYTMDHLAYFTLKAMRRAFENPAVQADYQKWLERYYLEHPERRPENAEEVTTS